MGRILDRLDARPNEERSRRFTFRLSEKTFPELFLHSGPDDADYLWSLIERMVSLGVIGTELDKRRNASPIAWERSPVLIVPPETEAMFREVLGRFPVTDPWAIEWRERCASASWLPDTLKPLLASREHRVGERQPAETLMRWKRLAVEEFPDIGLREISARIFWGVSKALDDRYDLVNALREANGLTPIADRPLLLPTFLPPNWQANGVLFVENLSSYVACLAGRVPASMGLAIIYGSGYRSAARRLREPGMTLLAFDPRGDRFCEPEFIAWLAGERDDIKAYFWGDLDFAGLAILRELRRAFPAMKAWEPGYAPMVAALEGGDGHTAAEADKRGQEDVGEVGCEYTDGVLLPILRRTGLFFDQEGVG